MGPPGHRQRLILFLADVSDVAVLLIAILEEDRTVEVLFVIVVRLGQHVRPIFAVGFPVGILRRRELGPGGFGDRPVELALRFARRFDANPRSCSRPRTGERCRIWGR